MSKAGGLRRRCPVDAHNSIALACSSTVCTWVKAFAFGENGQPIVRSCSRMALWGSAHNLVWAGAADSVARGQSKKQRRLETLKTSQLHRPEGLRLRFCLPLLNKHLQRQSWRLMKDFLDTAHSILVLLCSRCCVRAALPGTRKTAPPVSELNLCMLRRMA